MLKIVIECDAPGFAAFAVKESLAAYLEKFGDCRVVSVKEEKEPSEQRKLKNI